MGRVEGRKRRQSGEQYRNGNCRQVPHQPVPVGQADCRTQGCDAVPDRHARRHRIGTIVHDMIGADAARCRAGRPPAEIRAARRHCRDFRRPSRPCGRRRAAARFLPHQYQDAEAAAPARQPHAHRSEHRERNGRPPPPGGCPPTEEWLARPSIRHCSAPVRPRRPPQVASRDLHRVAPILAGHPQRSGATKPCFARSAPRGPAYERTH